MNIRREKPEFYDWYKNPVNPEKMFQQMERYFRNKKPKDVVWEIERNIDYAIEVDRNSRAKDYWIKVIDYAIEDRLAKGEKFPFS